MDPLKPEETEDLSISNSPIISANAGGELVIQLEGTHTTATETDTQNCKEKKNVKFDDDKDKDKHIGKQEEYLKVEEDKKDLESEGELVEVLVVNKDEKYATSKDFEIPKKLKNIATENLEISERFKQIMDMFDNFTKNLETLDLAVKPASSKELKMRKMKRKRPESVHMTREHDFQEPLKHRSRYEEYLKENEKKEDCQEAQVVLKQPVARSASSGNCSEDLISRQQFEDYLRQQQEVLKDLEHITRNARSISIATSSCELKTLGCQTQLNDINSLNDLNFMEVSSLTSRSEQPNSLNNYAQADNACVSHHDSQQEIMKKPLIETIIEQPLTIPTVTIERPVPPPFNIITIEAHSTPSSTDLRRAPLCQRLWSAIGDFCAATFLCLQVNRDCIFCLGFFAAFVVSASFLTAFFYHTLSVSPTLWQTEENIRI